MLCRCATGRLNHFVLEAAVVQQPCCSVVHTVDMGCKSCAPTALTLTRQRHLTSPSRCFTRLQRLFIAQFRLQMAAFDALHLRNLAYSKQACPLRVKCRRVGKSKWASFFGCFVAVPQAD